MSRSCRYTESEFANVDSAPVTLTLVCCEAMVRLTGNSAVPFRSNLATLSSKPSLLTRTAYLPAARLGTTNLPSPSVIPTTASVNVPPVISTRAPATTAPEGSLTVPVIVPARICPAQARHRKAMSHASRNQLLLSRALFCFLLRAGSRTGLLPEAWLRWVMGSPGRRLCSALGRADSPIRSCGPAHTRLVILHVADSLLNFSLLLVRGKDSRVPRDARPWELFSLPAGILRCE